MKNKKTLEKNKIYRICCLSKKKYEISQLIKITRANSTIYINNLEIKGRSVYFLVDEAKKININKFYNLINARLKFNLEEVDKQKINQFLNS